PRCRPFTVVPGDCLGGRRAVPGRRRVEVRPLFDGVLVKVGNGTEGAVLQLQDAGVDGITARIERGQPGVKLGNARRVDVDLVIHIRARVVEGIAVEGPGFRNNLQEAAAPKVDGRIHPRIFAGYDLPALALR